MAEDKIPEEIKKVFSDIAAYGTYTQSDWAAVLAWHEKELEDAIWNRTVGEE